MIGIGISTYGDYLMVDNLLITIIKKTDANHGKDYTILVVDDGTPDENIFSKLQEVCNKHGVRLLKNNENLGIAATWNRIAQNIGTDIVIILNNDILITNKDWLKYISYFFEHNDKVGMVGYPLINPPDFQMNNNDICDITWDPKIESRWGDGPGKCGAAVGCSFGIKKEVWEKVKNPDESTGFWESTRSFHEETHFGFKLSEMGYGNYMLPWPVMVHMGSQTFQRNLVLIERSVNWQKIEKEIGGSKDEYINIIRRSNVYPNEWKNNKIIWSKNGKDYVDRMAFSRYMFAKYWNVLDSYDAPQVPVHRKIIDLMPRKMVKYLDKNMHERECEA